MPWRNWKTHNERILCIITSVRKNLIMLKKKRRGRVISLFSNVIYNKIAPFHVLNARMLWYTELPTNYRNDKGIRSLLPYTQSISFLFAYD